MKTRYVGGAPKQIPEGWAKSGRFDDAIVRRSREDELGCVWVRRHGPAAFAYTIGNPFSDLVWHMMQGVTKWDDAVKVAEVIARMEE